MSTVSVGRHGHSLRCPSFSAWFPFPSLVAIMLRAGNNSLGKAPLRSREGRLGPRTAASDFPPQGDSMSCIDGAIEALFDVPDPAEVAPTDPLRDLRMERHAMRLVGLAADFVSALDEEGNSRILRLLALAIPKPDRSRQPL